MKAALINAALVGTGGFVGAIARYGVQNLVHRNSALLAFPYGTMAVNMLGCLMIGAAFGLVDSRQMFGPEFRLFALIGLLGGFTTWSTFGYETFALLKDAEYLRAVANVSIHVVLGILLVWAGFTLTSK